MQHFRRNRPRGTWDDAYSTGAGPCVRTLAAPWQGAQACCMEQPPSELLDTRWSRLDALQGSGAGSEDAWQWFVQRYRGFVRDVLASILRRQDLIDHAEQEFWGYLFLSRTIERADRQRRFRALLFGTVRNFARAWSRKQGLPQLDEATLQSLTADETGQGAAMIRWVESVIRNALQVLDAEHPQMARCMRLFYGLGADPQDAKPRPASDVARELAVTTQSVYMMLFRGRQRLRALVEEELRDCCQDEESYREELQLLLRLAASRLPGLVE